jgi:hypothetical protein
MTNTPKRGATTNDNARPLPAGPLRLKRHYRRGAGFGIGCGLGVGCGWGCGGFGGIGLGRSSQLSSIFSVPVQLACDTCGKPPAPNAIAVISHRKRLVVVIGSPSRSKATRANPDRPLIVHAHSLVD